MKCFVIALGLVLVATAADAGARVKIFAPSSKSNAEIICPWVSMGVPPETPAGHYTLGVCPPRPVVRPG